MKCTKCNGPIGDHDDIVVGTMMSADAEKSKFIMHDRCYETTLEEDLRRVQRSLPPVIPVVGLRGKCYELKRALSCLESLNVEVAT